MQLDFIRDRYVVNWAFWFDHLVRKVIGPFNLPELQV